MIMRVQGNLPQQDTIDQVQADGMQDAYNFTFYVPTPPDIAVYVTPVGQTPNPQVDIVDPSHYAVTFSDPIVNGGTVTFGGAYIPGNGTIVTLSRNMEFSLDTQFVNPQNFSGQNLDNALERIELQMQQLNTLQGQRNLSYAINSFTPPGTNNTNIPILGANQTWSKLTDNGNIVPVSIAGGGDASVLRSQLASQVMNADGSTIVGYYSVLQSLGMTTHAILAQLETSSSVVTSSGGAQASGTNTYTATLSPAITAYTPYMLVKIKISATNTSTTCTLNLNGLGTKNIKTGNISNPALGDLFIGQIAILVYDGTQFQLINPASAVAPSQNLAAIGHTVLPGGLIVNWATVTINGTVTGATVAFDKPFATSIFYSKWEITDQVEPITDPADIAGIWNAAGNATPLTHAQCFCNPATGGADNRTASVIAIGI